MDLVAGVVGWVLAAAAVAWTIVQGRAATGRMEAVARACHELRGPITAARLGLQLVSRAAGAPAGGIRAVELELSPAGVAPDQPRPGTCPRGGRGPGAPTPPGPVGWGDRGPRPRRGGERREGGAGSRPRPPGPGSRPRPPRPSRPWRPRPWSGHRHRDRHRSRRAARGRAL